MDALGLRTDFESLSIKDLLAARDLYHFHLMNKANVVGTAIGRYLIRVSDPWPTHKGEGGTGARRPGPKDERRFDNSEVRDYSWPCVLAMVDEWVDEADFGGGRGGLNPEAIVPKTLYMPDGRMVPVCVVRVPRSTGPERSLPMWRWPDTRIGGGFPLLIEHQGVERVASIGCLVSDGHTTYALTNRHVCGDAGSPVETIRAGERVVVGAASGRSLSRLPFAEVYPDFAGRRSYLTLDVGLVAIDDLTDWTSAIYGIGPIGELGDLHEANMTLRLIDQKVRAHGAASGRLDGRIKALFFRHKAVGGYDYVSDFLIAPEDAGAAQTQPGDSGTVWHLVVDEKADDLRPLAIEWGGLRSVGASVDRPFRFALATGLSNVCKLLDVELVRENDPSARPYWGRMGHYSIAAFAVDALNSGKLKTLMTANLDRISFARDSLDPDAINQALKEAADADDFTPLADVPDEVWKKTPRQRKGGRDRPAGAGRTTGPEHPTHYADIDEAGQGGKTLLQLSLADSGQNLTTQLWRDFYDAQGHTESRERGLLPFRVWQIFIAMAAAVREKRIDAFVAAAGILSHYVGDASQPLHGSVLSDGYKDRPKSVQHRSRETGELRTEESHEGAGVHSAFETKMIDRRAAEIVQALPEELGRLADVLPATKNGKDAAIRTLELMQRAASRIPPADLVDAYIAAGDKPTVGVQDALWERFGAETVATMADGARVLAHLWDAAWSIGNGDSVRASDLKAISSSSLMNLYRDGTFLPSLDLDAIDPALT